MNDGQIIAREFTGFFDSGAYMRLSPYAIIKGTGHLPGPYSIPNVSSNVYCVITNRTPATAMRGFGITAVDFAIECQMDRVAEAVGMNPVELRILNAYRDGDMKAHRRKAKNTALIECCQVAAGKAGWAISPDAAAQSSLTGGGTAERVAIPETVTDQEGKIGERRAGRTASTSPSTQSTGRVSAGTHGEATVGAPVQNPDMQIDADRIGHQMGATDAVLPHSAPAPTPPRSAVAAPPTAQAAPPQIPPATPPTPPAPAPAAAPYRPEQPFTRGTNRPGTSPFTSGFRRR
jgi:CO/xanthine dehydrogenase Mo-binding subunit